MLSWDGVFQCWSSVVFFFYHPGIYDEEVTLFDTSSIWVLTVFLFSIPFGSRYHARTFIPRYNLPSINTAESGIDPNNNSSYQRYSHLEIPTKYHNLTGITILLPTGRSFDTIIEIYYWNPRIHLCTSPTLVPSNVDRLYMLLLVINPVNP